MNKIKVTEDQKLKLHKIWFIYGNRGRKHTHHNHRFIQNLIEHEEDTEEFYREAELEKSKSAGIDLSTISLSDECVEKVREILSEENGEENSNRND